VFINFRFFITLSVIRQIDKKISYIFHIECLSHQHLKIGYKLPKLSNSIGLIHIQCNIIDVEYVLLYLHEKRALYNRSDNIRSYNLIEIEKILLYHNLAIFRDSMVCMNKRTQLRYRNYIK
jgi:hypothetical protein